MQTKKKIEATINQVLNMKIPIMSETDIKDPEVIIAIYKDYPTAIVKEKNTIKIVLIKDIIRNLKTLAKKDKNTKNNFEFLEYGTRLSNNLFKIVEKPEQKYKVSFLKNSKSNKSPQLYKKLITVPKRIWIIQKKKNIAKTFAIKEWNDEKTILYKMPFPNIFQDNHICWGTALKNLKKIDELEASLLDKIFFEESIFTPDNNSNVYYDKKEDKYYNSLIFWKTFDKVPSYDGLTKIGTLKEELKEFT